jgi:hypothetical protein
MVSQLSPAVASGRRCRQSSMPRAARYVARPSISRIRFLRLATLSAPHALEHPEQRTGQRVGAEDGKQRGGRIKGNQDETQRHQQEVAKRTGPRVQLLKLL